MPTRWRRSNPLALAVLASLSEKPMHPYEIAQTLRLRAKHESIKLNYGSLYNVVDSLEQHGLITARETIREGRRPERTIYGITDSGTREMTDWMAELLADPVKEYPKFVAALSLLAAVAPNEAADLLGQRVETLTVTLAQSRGARRSLDDTGLPRLFTIEEEYREALIEAEIDFCQRLVKDIETGHLGGIELWRSLYEDT